MPKEIDDLDLTVEAAVDAVGDLSEGATAEEMADVIALVEEAQAVKDKVAEIFSDDEMAKIIWALNHR